MPVTYQSFKYYHGGIHSGLNLENVYNSLVPNLLSPQKHKIEVCGNVTLRVGLCLKLSVLCCEWPQIACGVRMVKLRMI